MEREYLEVRRDGGAEQVPLVGEQLTLGRADANTVSFPSDSAMSRSHAVLERVPGGWQLRDVGSANGTFVNGARVDSARMLQPGDEVVLGESHLVYRSAGADDATVVHPQAAPADPPVAEAPPAPPPAGDRGGGYLGLGEEWQAASPAGAAPPPPTPQFAPASAPTPPAPAPVAEDSTLRSRGQGHVRGVARGIQIRRTQDDRELLAFRVDRYDESGNRLAPVAVELMDYQRGMVGEGEEVEVIGKWSRGTLRASRVINLSTRAEAHGMGSARKIAFIVALIVIACFFAFIIYSIVSAPDVSNPFQGS